MFGLRGLFAVAAASYMIYASIKIQQRQRIAKHREDIIVDAVVDEYQRQDRAYRVRLDMMSKAQFN